MHNTKTLMTLLIIFSAAEGRSRFQAESRGTQLHVSETSFWGHKGKRHILKTDQEALYLLSLLSNRRSYVLCSDSQCGKTVQAGGGLVGATIIFELAESCVPAPPQMAFTRGSEHFGAVSFHSSMPTHARSSLLFMLIMWFISRWGHSVQQQVLEIFTGSLISSAACRSWGPEPSTDFCSSVVCTFAGPSGCCWILSCLLPHQIGQPLFFGHYCLYWLGACFYITYKENNFHKNCKKQGYQSP